MDNNKRQQRSLTIRSGLSWSSNEDIKVRPDAEVFTPDYCHVWTFSMVTGHHERRKLFWKIKEYGLSEEKLIRFVRVCLNDYI